VGGCSLLMEENLLRITERIFVLSAASLQRQEIGHFNNERSLNWLNERRKIGNWK
jgi:hypothetical protein